MKKVIYKIFMVIACIVCAISILLGLGIVISQLMDTSLELLKGAGIGISIIVSVGVFGIFLALNQSD